MAEDTLETPTVAREGNTIPSTAAGIDLTKTRHRTKYGRAIHFRGLGYAPTNELGVIFVFGMLAGELRFEVDSIQSSFPDCEAKRKSRDGTWERAMIEFEFRSSEFERHKHDPAGCDYLVCWVHDWKDCPNSLDVIELSEEVRKRTL